MAGDDDGDRILMVRLAHGTESMWTADSTRYFSIRTRFAIRNPEQGFPAVFLKWCPNQIEFASEFTKLPAKIRGDLLCVRLQAFT